MPPWVLPAPGCGQPLGVPGPGERAALGSSHFRASFGKTPLLFSAEVFSVAVSCLPTLAAHPPTRPIENKTPGKLCKHPGFFPELPNNKTVVLSASFGVHISRWRPSLGRIQGWEQVTLLLGRAHGRKVKQLGYFPLSDLELGSVRPLGQGICSQPATAPTFPDSIFLWLRAADRPCVVLVALKDVFRESPFLEPIVPAAPQPPPPLR